MEYESRAALTAIPGLLRGADQAKELSEFGWNPELHLPQALACYAVRNKRKNLNGLAYGVALTADAERCRRTAEQYGTLAIHWFVP